MTTSIAAQTAGRQVKYDAPEGFSPRRVWAMVLRYYYLLRGSWPRILELAYWPMVQMILWGFISQFFATNSSWVMRASGVLIGAMLLWDVLFRSQLGVSLSFMEEMWSRQLGHLCATPLRPIEHIVSLLVLSLVRTLIGIIPASCLAIVFYHYSIFTLGPALVLFFANLMVMGWSIGLFVSGIVLRYGLGAESMAWFLIFAIAPFTGIYYPVASLPQWLHPLAWALPSAYVFEGMRAAMFDHVFRGDLLAMAGLLNAVYITLGAATFLYMFHVARVRGLLLQIGE